MHKEQRKPGDKAEQKPYRVEKMTNSEMSERAGNQLDEPVEKEKNAGKTESVVMTGTAYKPSRSSIKISLSASDADLLKALSSAGEAMRWSMARVIKAALRAHFLG
ncbi:MAG: hypothetical protein HQL84_17095 [Magnetococcales bacterium]|nr:hypothetical protein [Magnetococcales bacterium]